MSEQVVVLIIHHKHGEDVSVHRSQETVDRALENWVAEWWYEEVHPLEGEPTPMPEDAKQAVEDYFNIVEEEWHQEITTSIVDAPVSIDKDFI